MSDTPMTDAIYALLPSTCDTLVDAKACQALGSHARKLERELSAVTARAEAAERERDALREDAERYRWLREESKKRVEFSSDEQVWENVETAIDSARKANG